MPIYIANTEDAEKPLPGDTPMTDDSLQAAAVARQNALGIWERETPWPWELDTIPPDLDIDYWVSDGGVVLPRKHQTSDVTTNTGSDRGLRDESSLESQYTQNSYKSFGSTDMPVPAPQVMDVPNDDMEALFLISFTRCPSEFRLGLVEGPLLRECREDMAAQGFSCELATGAKIFCEPEYYTAISRAVKDLESTLRPYHVIVTEKFRQLLLQTAKACPRSMKVKVKEDRVIACFGKGRWIPFTWSPEKMTQSRREQGAQPAAHFSQAPSGHEQTQVAAQPPMHSHFTPPPMPQAGQPAFEKAVLDELQRALACNPFGFDLPTLDRQVGSFDPQMSFPAWGQNLGRRPGQF